MVIMTLGLKKARFRRSEDKNRAQFFFFSLFLCLFAQYLHTTDLIPLYKNKPKY